MVIHEVIYDPSTFGITGKSLLMLRNALVNNLRDEIIVMKIQTGDITCGFLLLNKTNKTATWSGDGFRTDRGGEGGRGYAAAEKLLGLFGIQIFESYMPQTPDAFINAINNYASNPGQHQAFMNACRKAASEIEYSEFKCYYNTVSWY